MNIYYQEELVTVYCGDAREIVPTLEPVDIILTDPVWPNAIPQLVGSERPWELFEEFNAAAEGKCQRMGVVMGCNSDPRFLKSVPMSLPFLRVMWLAYVIPGYSGRILDGAEVCYVFGPAPPVTKGRRIIPGETRYRHSGRNTRNIQHPTPREFWHMDWLVKWLANGTILDPFAGSGTTLLAARKRGYPSIGIEIEERHCEEIVRRLKNEKYTLKMPLKFPEDNQQAIAL
jgi:hypothetical protein